MPEGVPGRGPGGDPVELADVRARIDDADRKLLRLLDERVELALRAGRLKTDIADPAREAQVLENVASAAHGLLSRDFVTGLYRAIIDESRRLQSSRPGLAGFQGERGAWSEMACQAWDGRLVPVPCRSFNDVFDGVERGAFDRGVVPVENSLGGAVVDVSDLLIARDLSIVGEVLLPVRQCLLALPGAPLSRLRSVYSHPQALAQCRAFLAANDLDPHPFYDTAGAARWLMFEGDRTAGVIASPLAATLYGLEVVAEAVADDPGNETRFVVISANARGRRRQVLARADDGGSRRRAGRGAGGVCGARHQPLAHRVEADARPARDLCVPRGLSRHRRRAGRAGRADGPGRPVRLHEGPGLLSGSRPHGQLTPATRAVRIVACSSRWRPHGET